MQGKCIEIGKHDDEKDVWRLEIRKHLWAIASSEARFTYKETLDRWAAYLGPKLAGIPILGIFWADLWGIFLGGIHFVGGGFIWNSTLASISEGRGRHCALPLDVRLWWMYVVTCDEEVSGKNKVVLKWTGKPKIVWIISLIRNQALQQRVLKCVWERGSLCTGADKNRETWQIRKSGSNWRKKRRRRWRSQSRRGWGGSRELNTKTGCWEQP